MKKFTVLSAAVFFLFQAGIFSQDAAPVKRGEVMNPLEQVSENEVMNYLKTERPSEHQNLLGLKENAPAEYNKQLNKYKIMYYFSKNPGAVPAVSLNRRRTARNNNMRLQQLAEEYRKATDAAAKETIKTEITGLITQDIEKQIESDRRNIEAMKKRIEATEKVVEKNIAEKNKMIEDRFNNLINNKPSPLPLRNRNAVKDPSRNPRDFAKFKTRSNRSSAAVPGKSGALPANLPPSAAEMEERFKDMMEKSRNSGRAGANVLPQVSPPAASDSADTAQNNQITEDENAKDAL